MVDKLIGVLGEEGWAWFELADLRGSGLDETMAADGVGLDLRRGVVGVQNGHWVWVEAENDQVALRADVGAGTLDELLVTEVDAVEVSDDEGGGSLRCIWGHFGHGEVYRGGVR